MELATQLDLLEDPNDEFLKLRHDLETLTLVMSNVRKGLFARHKELEKTDNYLLSLVLQQQEEIAKLREMMIKANK